MSMTASAQRYADPGDLTKAEMEAIVRGQHGDPFSVLGLHRARGGLVARVFDPAAAKVELVDRVTGRVAATLPAVHPGGLFSGPVEGQAPFAYSLMITLKNGEVIEREDAYRFPPALGEMDLHLLGEGNHLDIYEKLGAHPMTLEGVDGVNFAVWAPNARRVSVVGVFNDWDGRQHPMRLHPSAGIWEIFVPATASVVHGMPKPYEPSDAWKERRKRINALDEPISIYEVHLGSWRRGPNNGFLTYDEIADQMIPYVQDMGFTHVELMPVSEFPFDGSWGYQPLGLYAPTSRFGDPDDFARFVARFHEAGIGVIVDWVAGHFPTDTHGLGRFDGTALYEHEDPRLGFHHDWNTLIFNYGRREVSNFLLANALFWFERFGIDGIRADAVASMLYLDYSRKAGEWIPNEFGGNENLPAIAFIKRLNELIYGHHPEASTMAEESTAWPAVSRPVYLGGLGFGYKWNMGWMHDTLDYMSKETVHRKYHHNQLTFGLIYAFTENFILPLSHDEVVHGKGSLLDRMPGDPWQKFANLRAYYGFMWTHPGKKLLFMGGEFAQGREWSHDHALDWWQLDDPQHAGVRNLVRDLNHAYRSMPALYRNDFQPSGFEWIEGGDAEQSMISYLRHAPDAPPVLVISNFTPVPRENYRVPLPLGGNWIERINTDAGVYGGSNMGNGGAIRSEPTPLHGRPYAAVVTVPPLATLVFEYRGE
jgi:1,4-alpha-glucan branching enzyme